MPECVILFRAGDGAVDFVRTGDRGLDIHVYPNKDAAIEDTKTRRLFRAAPYQIVELNELWWSILPALVIGRTNLEQQIWQNFFNEVLSVEP